MKKIKKMSVIALCSLFCIVNACKKDFLEAKPNTSLLLLNTLADSQKLLSNTAVLNQTGSLPLAMSDEYVVTDYPTYQTMLRQTTKNAYIWAQDLYGGEVKITDWNVPYSAIFYANSVLDALQGNDQKGTNEWNRTKGWALFARAFAYYDLVQNFCNTYDAKTATTDLGLPLRQTPGVDELLPRSNLQDTYQLILMDLGQARHLLTDELPTVFRNEPSRQAVYAMYSRIFLSMRDYTQAEIYADSTLMMQNRLIDYNTVSTSATTPFIFANAETIYQATQINDYMEVTTSITGKYDITSELLDLYATNDLRPVVFFRKHANGTTFLRLGYSARANLFTGLSIDELYLIKAECAARRSATSIATQYLNDLLIKRYKTGTFINFAPTSAGEALQLVLIERRKELVRRGLRWSDLKRLNKEGANITLTRTLNGQTYSLPANDPRYVFPIPSDEISFSGIQQNPK